MWWELSEFPLLTTLQKIAVSCSQVQCTPSTYSSHNWTVYLLSPSPPSPQLLPLVTKNLIFLMRCWGVFLVKYVKEIIQYLFFSVSLISFSKMPQDLSMLCQMVGFPHFYGSVMSHCLCVHHTICIHACIDGCFHVLAIINNAVIGVQIPFGTTVFDFFE